eukprot:TRINITY_DN1068_c0_g2_i1.p1 TRINITY_DN1068_c0_g2~~TRINITY_DN1068_c0_g2_i1.p1  ORF type:complete len:201 (-),score=52.43 TRINITY_DN1068_c0_g2_i1:20-622(-)
MAKGMEMFIMLPMIFIIQKIDFTVPRNVLIVQSAFAIIQTLLLLASTYIYTRINARNDTSTINVVVSKPGEETRTETQTVRDHDMAALKKFVTQLIMGTAITAFLYFKWAIVPPLLMQSVINPMNFYKTQLFKIFILGENEANHPRPWKEDNPMAGLFGQQQEEPAQNNTNGTNTIENETEPSDKPSAPKPKKNKAKKDE